ncbi:hypothetical protein B0H14DRAFT_3176116 [Mycena olivaceomarginata]|nr:hypothetical protein B0H14DRAFT_3176116 [Mycena olivaceomarginata]
MLSPSESVSKSTDTPLDTPPAYDGAGASSSTQPPIIEKLSATQPPTFATSPSTSTANFGAQSRVVLKHLNEPPRPWVATAARRDGGPPQTVSGLIHDLVRDQNLDSSGDQHARRAAAAYIEGHTPLYWAIVKRTIDVVRATAGVVRTPAADPRIAHIFRAPREVDAQGYTPRVSSQRHCHNKTQLLLGVQVPLETVVVGTPARDDAPFAVEFEFAQFQKRMRVAQEVYLEFISHDLLLCGLKHNNIKDGRWVVRLGGTEDSPSTFVQAASVRLELGLKGEQHVALPDAIQYPQSPFLTADGTLRRKLTVQITRYF